MRQSKHWVEFADDWRDAPLAYWVHIEQNSDSWRDASQYSPEAPELVLHRGYRMICVEFDDIVLRFSSPEQLAECIRVLSMKPLPTSRRLTMVRGASLGPNSHWLSRMPAKLKAPKTRLELVKILRVTMQDVGTLNSSLNPVAMRRSA